ncbi:hypothetical protein BU17DRAFT_88223 [Hysterangium stoloniferum]|nr:hypothetical protein BU17DRAFT_88223 [Hysterangium stoloniferum]
MFVTNDLDYGLVCALEDVNPSLTGKKLRVAGKILSYDPSTYLLLIADLSSGLLIDLRLCLDPAQMMPFLHEMKGTLMVLGSLEHVELPLQIPALPKFVDVPAVDSRIVIRAILVNEVNDLNLEQWRKGVQAIQCQVLTSQQ